MQSSKIVASYKYKVPANYLWKFTSVQVVRIKRITYFYTLYTRIVLKKLSHTRQTRGLRAQLDHDNGIRRYRLWKNKIRYTIALVGWPRVKECRVSMGWLNRTRLRCWIWWRNVAPRRFSFLPVPPSLAPIPTLLYPPAAGSPSRGVEDDAKTIDNDTIHEGASVMRVEKKESLKRM